MDGQIARMTRQILNSITRRVPRDMRRRATRRRANRGADRNAGSCSIDCFGRGFGRDRWAVAPLALPVIRKAGLDRGRVRSLQRDRCGRWAGVWMGGVPGC
ncbi:hypothetical protein L810_6093 [Burkholderia sp. AU4i]|nr:hypothetical protein L810_6093 [Burkholderia sp. AU4i]